MKLSVKSILQKFWQPLLIAAALLFLYAAVLERLVQTWWTDENYSHGLLIPFLIGYLVWLEAPDLEKLEKRGVTAFGGLIVAGSIFLLLLGTLGAEVFSQRISLLTMLVGVVLYFFGWRVLRQLVVPFILLALAIPIPTIIFNQIAFPLQLLATDLAVWGVRLFAIPAVKFGNVIEILPLGASQSVMLEVVEACSGIRSLMTLVSLALVYAYFTSARKKELPAFWRDFNFWRAVILMFAAVPVAVLTNAARVTATVLIAFEYGGEAAKGFIHGVSGWIVYVAALLLLLLAAFVIDRTAKVLKLAS